LNKNSAFLNHKNFDYKIPHPAEIKRYRTNKSESKKRTKSFKRIKENEFRKLLRPCQMSVNSGNSKPSIDTEKFNINHLIEGPINENVLFKTLEDIKGRNFKYFIEIAQNEKKSKSGTKVAANRSRTEFLGEYATNSHILKEKCLNSVKCNLWITEDSSLTDKSQNSSIDLRQDKNSNYRASVKNLTSLRHQNINLFNSQMNSSDSQ
jgi:hypothetical protein